VTVKIVLLQQTIFFLFVQTLADITLKIIFCFELIYLLVFSNFCALRRLRDLRDCMTSAHPQYLRVPMREEGREGWRAS
jgi:hypothetical protein